MATSPASVRFKKRLRRRFGISAPRLAIRTHVAWYWRALLFILALAAALFVAAWIYDAGKRIGGFHSTESAREVQALKAQVVELNSELATLRSVAGSGESALQIERATQKQLSLHAKVLEVENEALREDLAFFEGLVPVSESSDESGVRIDNLRVYPGAVVGEYRYRMLVVNGGWRQARDLKGALQLVIKMGEADKNAMITLPSGTEQNPQRFRFEIKHFHRLEGGFFVPPGAAVREVEVRVLQDGSVRATRSVIL